ncbi:MAG: MBL fold metallo-hydrolase [Spirochaetes bacterium]|nr:MBL fold metallo-hydrolase [Spirochaetota bacterium]
MNIETFINNITHLGHASIKIKYNNKVIYIDPFKISNNEEKADYIFSTHPHFDHYSEEDINKLIYKNTVLIVVEELKNKANKLNAKEVIFVNPGFKQNHDSIIFETVYAYNINKNFHPKSNNWVGYIIEIDGIKIYHAGDTDFIPEMKNLKTDIAFLPIGGTYTMNYKEAAEAANSFKPKIAIPIHFGSIIGTKSDAQNFISLLNKDIKGIIL